jgi:uncharacterized protein YodC (DUF2158 family)
MEMKIGDVVRLKSGGPRMTILGGNNKHWVCQWFNNAGLDEGTFAAASLQPVEDNDGDAALAIEH